MGKIKEDISYAVKDKEGNYFAGQNKWEDQLRKAKLYHSLKYAKDIVTDYRFEEKNPFIVKVKIAELENIE